MYIAPHKRNGSYTSHTTQVNGVHKTEASQQDPTTSPQPLTSEPAKPGPPQSVTPKWGHGNGATFAQIVKQNSSIPMKEPVPRDPNAQQNHVMSRGVSKPRPKAMPKGEDMYIEEDTDFDVKPVTWKNDGKAKKCIDATEDSNIANIDWGEPVGVRADKATMKREGKKRLDHEYRRQKAIMTKGAQRAGVEVMPLMESFGAFAQKQQQWKSKKLG